MKRHFAACFALISLFALCATALADMPGKLVSESDANAVGMTRAWFAQATLLRGQENVASVTFQDGVLFTATENGRLQAFDGETGVTLWTVECGSGYLLPPGVNSKVVAAVCGTNLLIYDRFTGKKLSETVLYGNPSAGPIVSEREVYVPVYSERVLAYPIVKEDQETDKVSATLNTMTEAAKDLGNASDYWEKKLASVNDKIKNASYAIKDINAKRPYSCPGIGIPMVSPILGTQSYDLDVVGWTTDQGWLVLGEMLRRSDDDPFKLLYKLQARPNFSYVNDVRVGNKALIPRDDLECTPFFFPEDKSAQNMRLPENRRQGGLFIVGSESGHVYAMNDVTGMLRWTFLTRTPVSSHISAFDDHAYVPTESGDYFAVDLKTGEEAWVASDIAKTLSASQARLYTLDTRGRLVVVDRATGERQKVLNIGLTKFQVFNQENDRVYIVSSDGLVQCLRETQLVEPIRHRESCAAINARIMAQMAKENPELVEAAAKKADAAVAAPTLDEDDEAEEEVEEADDDPFGSDDEDDATSADDEEVEEDEDDPFGGDDDF